MKDKKNGVFQLPVIRKLFGVKDSNLEILFCRPISSFSNKINNFFDKNVIKGTWSRF